MSAMPARLMAKGTVKKSYQGDEKMAVVLTITGLTGLALLVYLFYILFRGEEL